jgi:hypothetical protein
MNSDQAKEVLLLYRPGTDDRQDPEMAEAIEATKHDPELAAWFAQHCVFQETAAGAFDRIPVPEGLREQILSERKAHFNLGVTKRIAVAAVALALVVLSLSLARFYTKPSENNEFANFRTRMAGMVVRFYPKMDLETNDLATIRSFLASKGGHANYSLPPQLAQASGTGCAILPWHGKRVSMVCMNSGKNGAPMKPDLFLFIIDRKAIEHAPESSPQKEVVSGLASASWTSGDNTYVLLASGDAAPLPLNL